MQRSQNPKFLLHAACLLSLSAILFSDVTWRSAFWTYNAICFAQAFSTILIDICNDLYKHWSYSEACFTPYLWNAVVSGKSFVFHAFVDLKLLVLLISHLVACSARNRVNRQIIIVYYGCATNACSYHYGIPRFNIYCYNLQNKPSYNYI